MHLPSYSKVIVLIGLAAFGLSAAAQYKWTNRRRRQRRR